MVNKGYLISFEGGEACGKDTQIDLLKDRLRRENYSINEGLFREPGTTPFGLLDRMILKRAIDDPRQEPYRPVLSTIQEYGLSSTTQAFLFLANRADIFEKELAPAVQKNQIVILNRSVDSTTVYQGHQAGADEEGITFMRKANERIQQANVPINLTFFLDVAPEIAYAWLQKRPDRDNNHDLKPLDFHQRLHRGYQLEAAHYSQRFVTINGNPLGKVDYKHAEKDTNIALVHEQIYRIVMDRLASHGYKR